MKHSKAKKLLSLLLAIVTVMGLLPMTAYATDNEQGIVEQISQEEENSENKEVFTEEVTIQDTTVIESDDANTQEAASEQPEAKTSDCLEEENEILAQSNEGVETETHNVFSRKTSNLAPGVTQDVVYAYNSEGKQIVYYIATANINNDDVNVYANYKDNQCKNFGMAKLTEQMASAQAKHSNPEDTENYIEYYNVIAGVNADFYNMTTGRPSGAFVMEGVKANGANNRPWFAILDDGSAAIGYNDKDWVTVADRVQEAVGGSQVLVWEGKDVTAGAGGSYNTDRHSRTCVGITGEGKVVMMVLDGRQEPFSAGGSMHELAQIMLEAGCVSAINLDGGGSTTFAARQEGENSVSIVNRPSDGSERSISSSLMIVSTAVPSDEFNHAILTAENEYITPGSSVKITATGVSPAGTASDIPENVLWKMENNDLGTVDNGIFTSSGNIGDAIIQMVYNGQVVGETIIHVVVPDKISFLQDPIVVPFGKSIELGITATYGVNKVLLKEEDLTFKIQPESLGTVEGITFIAAENSEVTEGTITAELAWDTSKNAVTTLNLGKGSEIIYDFEDNKTEGFRIGTGYPQYGPVGPNGKVTDENGKYWYNGQNEKGRVYTVTAETGKVHSGKYALALECDFTQVYETGYQLLNFSGINIHADANAQAFGAWIYVPELEDVKSTYVRFCGQRDSTALSGSTKNDVTLEVWPTGYATTLKHEGWHYFSGDLSGFNEGVTISLIQVYISDRDGGSKEAGYEYSYRNTRDGINADSKFTLYMDDFTVDYSSAVDDREAPVFSNVLYADETMSDAVELKGQASKCNTVSISAKVADNVEKNNYTGLDSESAKAYIDGVEATEKLIWANSETMVLESINLSNGIHTFKFEVSDKAGNTSFISRQITIDAESNGKEISLSARTPDADKIPIGSIYWIDLKAANLTAIDSVTTVLNLNSVSNWELEGMEVAFGFTSEYTIDPVTNNATIIFKRTEENNNSTDILASIPIRTWISRITEDKGYENQTPQALWKRNVVWSKSIDLSMNYGQVIFVDGSKDTFSMEKLHVNTELYAYRQILVNDGYYNSSRNSWHIHIEENLLNKEPGCKESGYINRTFCKECESVVDWGTVIPAKGHSYEITDGILKCQDCELLYTGEYEGKAFIDGVVVSDGWVDNSYYVDGVKLKGIQLLDGFYYDFGENGVSVGKYTGVFYDKEVGAYRYSQLGTLSTGWKMIDGDWYYFRNGTGMAQPGDYEISGVTYRFEENGKLISGVWVDTPDGKKYSYGPNYYYEGWNTIDGKTYYFKNYYRYEGYHYVAESNSHKQEWYDFGDDGALVGKLNITQFIELDGKLYYVKDGFSQKGLCLIDGDYYYFNSAYTAVTGNYFVTTNNGLLPSAMYMFGSDGKMLQGIMDAEDGNLYYYVNGARSYAGLIQINNDYYYVNGSGKIVTGRYYVTKTNNLMPSGYYEFSAEGKMQRDKDKNGIVAAEDGTLYYYVDGVKTYAGLIQINGDYYYINGSCKVVVGKYYVTRTNGLIPPGYYEFDSDGKMQKNEEKNGIIAEKDGSLYYYENGVKTYAGLIQIDKDYYYVCGSCKVVTGRYYVTKTNGLIQAGYYEFGTDGKLQNGEKKNGIVTESDGVSYYYVDGNRTYAGLIQINEDYYYVNGSCKIVTGRYYVTKSNGLMDCGYYEFGSDGKMKIQK